jgi:integrase
MAVYDRWHVKKPRRGEDGNPAPECKEHGLNPGTEHGNGDRWQVRWRDEQDKQCKRNFPRKTGKNPQTCAEAFDAQIKHELDTGTYVAPEDADTPFKAFAEEWRKIQDHDVRTAERHERQLRLHVYPVIGNRTLRELDKRPSLTKAWVKGIKASVSYRNHIVLDVSSIFNAAIDDGLMRKNPTKARSVKRTKAPKEPVHTWPLEWIDGMADQLPRFWSIVPYLTAGTGMRQGEVFGFAVEDANFLHRMVHVRRQIRLIGNELVFSPIKNDRIHEVPLSKTLGNLLSEHIREFPPVEVTLPWETPDGEPVTHQLVLTRPSGLAMRSDRFDQDYWRPARKRLGIPDTRYNGMHVLRHTFATRCLASGVDVATVAEWLGDTVKTVVDVYLHPSKGSADLGRRAIDTLFKGETSEASALHVPSEAR